MSCSASTPTGGPPTTSRSARSTCWTTRCCASRCARARQAAAARPLGHDARASTSSTRTSTGSIARARPRHDLRRRARATAARRWSPTPGWRAPTARSTRDVSQDDGGHGAAVPQFSFPGGIPSHVAPETPGLDPRGRRARLRARRTPTAPPSTTRTCSSPASSATARPRPARWPPSGTRTSSSTRRATARCCRSCTSTATRSPTRRCWPASRATS